MEPRQTTDSSESRQLLPPSPAAAADSDTALGQDVPERVQAYLAERGQLAAGDLERVRRLGGESGERWANLLIRLGLVSERDLAQAFSEVTGLPLMTGDDYPETPELERLLPMRFNRVRAHKIKTDWEDHKRKHAKH